MKVFISTIFATSVAALGVQVKPDADGWPEWLPRSITVENIKYTIEKDEENQAQPKLVSDKGAYSRVYVAKNETTKALVALKVSNLRALKHNPPLLPHAPAILLVQPTRDSRHPTAPTAGRHVRNLRALVLVF